MADNHRSQEHTDHFDRYLTAKRTVDDRALNQTVWHTLRTELAARPAGALNVVELGAGIGTMLQRIADWNLFDARPVTYLAIDQRPDNVNSLQKRYPRPMPGMTPAAEAVHAEEFLARPKHRHSFDLVIAHAFLDLVDLPTVLPAIRAILRPDGLLYATINFDGLTVFEPPLDPDLDRKIEALYHQTMDERRIDGKPSGDSRTGRHLFQHLRRADLDIVAAGSSDWVVFADSAGRYQDDEAFFLGYILGFVEDALTGRTELDAGDLTGWLEARRRQLERGELIYLAHQLDFLASAADYNAGAI